MNRLRSFCVTTVREVGRFLFGVIVFVLMLGLIAIGRVLIDVAIFGL